MIDAQTAHELNQLGFLMLAMCIGIPSIGLAVVLVRHWREVRAYRAAQRAYVTATRSRRSFCC